MKTLSIDIVFTNCYSILKQRKEVMLLTLNWSIILGLAFSYVAGTVFGYVIAIQRGRKEGIEISLDSLIARGYVRSGVNNKGEVVIYKYWEKEKTNNDTE